MKRGMYAIFLAGLLAAAPAARSATVAYWDFEDGTDGQLFDADGGGDSGSVDTVNDILMRGFDAQWGASFSADNLYYNGLCMRAADSHQDGYVINSPLQFWAPTNWTIECTARLDELDGWRTLITRDGSVQYEPHSDFYLQKSAINNSFTLNFKTIGGRRVIIEATNVVAQAGRWYGIAAVSDGQEARLYIDEGSGYELEASTALPGTNAAENALPGSPFQWTFGRGWYAGNHVDRINGAMDNIRFTDTALMPDELIPLPKDPFRITFKDAGPAQPIEISVVNGDSEFSSAVLSIDGTAVVTNRTPDGSTNGISYATEKLAAGAHTAEVEITGTNPAVTVTQSWTFATRPPPVETRIDGAEPGRWTMDLDAAKQVAAEQHLPILLDFSGSDWCGWCMLMESNVFTRTEWTAYATNHIMMVLIDFPQDKSLVPEKYRERNDTLKKSYEIRGYPTYIVLDEDGKTELGRLSAGRDKTPASFIAELEQRLALRSSGIEAFTETLSPEDQTTYRNLIEKLEATKLEKQEGEKKLRKLMMEAQLDMFLLSQFEEWQRDDLRYFRISRELEDAERQTFEDTLTELQGVRDAIVHLLSSSPETIEANDELAITLTQKLEALKTELSRYDRQKDL